MLEVGSRLPAVNPSSLHVTFELASVHSVLQTDPHTSKWQTSRLPSLAISLPVSLKSPSLHLCVVDVSSSNRFSRHASSDIVRM